MGKFDWRKQLIGIPKFVYHHPSSDNTIVATESNVIASLHNKDGSIIWRQLLQKECILDHMSILKSNDDHRDYLIRTSCTMSRGSNQTQIWNPLTGLLASQARYKEIAEDDQSESLLSETGHLVDTTRAFTISEDQSLLVSNDGKVTFNNHDRVIWTREESLASVTCVEFVKLPVDMRDSFGLKKMIVLVTDLGKVFGIDTFTGEISWHLFDIDLSTRNLGTSTSVLIITKQSDDDDDQSRAIVIHPRGLILHINPITGQLLEKKSLKSAIKQIAKTELFEEDDSRGIIILDMQDNVHIYPKSIEERVRNGINKYYMTIVDKTRVDGYKFSLDKKDSSIIVPRVIWTYSTNETIINLNIKRIDEEVHSPARVLGDRGILYKYLNPNLMAVMTESKTGDVCQPNYHINIHLIDGVTGSLVHAVHHPKSRGPAKMVHSENWLVYSYYNIKTRRTEVSSLEMFEGTVQTNPSTFSSLTRAPIKPKLIEHKSFIFPSGIDAMVDTVTLRGMTNRHIIVAVPSGGLLEIPKIFLDPRRPINILPEHREEGLIPYMPELPIPSESMINYDQNLMDIRKITTSPAILESTSLVFAYGLDLFFSRVTPSKPFDILKDDFDHTLISIVLIFLVVASYVTKLLAQRKALRAAWK